ncbi:hypothetical protein WJX74_001693 [Apatococcus lobatus]|uniref:Uncharacterized protein n=1 Tax=Apatococcus lobatus TaxID=904363 RepID=A0AAW1R3S8_9CHLO
MDREYRKACSACESYRKPVHCPDCLNGPILKDKRLLLQQLQVQKNALLEQLVPHLASREQSQRQQGLHEEQLASLRAASIQAVAAQDHLRQVRARCLAAAAKNEQQGKQLKHASDQLAAKRKELLVHTLPSQLAGREMQLHVILEGLLLEQRLRMRQLLQVLPFGISQRRRPGAPPRVTICGLRLPSPEDPRPAPENTVQQQEVGTALGLCATALQMAADTMGGPILAQLGLQASTSTIWLPRTFWNPKPPRSGPQAHAPRALFLQATPAASPEATAAGSQTSATATGWSLTSLAQQAQQQFWTGAGLLGGHRGPQPLAPHAPGRAMTNAEAAAASQQPSSLPRRSMDKRLSPDPALARAMLLLQTAIEAFVGSCLGPPSQVFPSSWTHFAWLAGLCGHAAKEPRAGHAAGQGRMMASQMSMLGGASLMASHRFTSSLALNQVAHGGIAEDGEEGTDGWDLVQRPGGGWSTMRAAEAGIAGPGMSNFMLPPPPSQPELVEQWARAMFTDQVFHVGRPPPGSACGPVQAPAGILSAAVDRLRSLAVPVAFPTWGPAPASLHPPSRTSSTKRPQTATP